MNIQHLTLHRVLQGTGEQSKVPIWELLDFMG